MKIVRAVLVPIVAVLTFAGIGLTATPANASTLCIHTTITVGATGHCVRDIQYMLNEINSAFGETGQSYKPVPPQLVTDGIYGPATSFTVGHYQVWKHSAVNGNTHDIPEWGWFCGETAVADWIHSPFLILAQAAFSAVEAGCPLTP